MDLPLALTVRLGSVTSQNWAEGLLIPTPIAEALLERVPHKRFIVTVADQLRLHNSLIKVGGEYFIYLAKEKRGEIGVEVGDAVAIVIEEDTSEYGHEFPVEWEEMMALDPEVADWFRQLTPGRQRNILHQVSSPKNVTTRIRRALMIADYLRAHTGKFDARALAVYGKAWRKDNPG